MSTKEFTQQIKDELGFDFGSMPADKLPDNEEELQLHMQLNYKQAIEIAEEQALASIFELNKYENIRKRLSYDMTVLGMAAVKNTFTESEGIKLEYVDPANIVYSYTESPYFDDVYYVGEIKNVNLNDLKMQFPNLTNEQLKKIAEQGGATYDMYNLSLIHI